jgi:leucyl aminopeptidase
MIYNVGRAAKDEDRQPRLICIHYQPSSSTGRKICLVGKGVTYDTGGLNIKPGSSMLNMKKDMGGAAHVLGLLMALVEQDFPHEIQVWIPAVENVVDADSYRPGDVLTSVNGKTTEVGNTDAEGRLVLADALALASAEQDVDLIVDFATLTGAARVAMGTEVVPFFSNTAEYSDGLAQAARQVHDPMWELPLWDGYRERITTSSKIADLRNVPSDNGLGGAITAALYLQEFVGETNGKPIPWIHLDVYGMDGTAGIGKAQGLRSMFRFLCNIFDE